MSEEATIWDAPNQQVVRRDASAPWEEGDGGPPGDQTGEGEAPVEEEAGAEATDYESMTKADLLELGKSRGLSPMNNDQTKAEIIATLEAG